MNLNKLMTPVFELLIITNYNTAELFYRHVEVSIMIKFLYLMLIIFFLQNQLRKVLEFLG